MKRTLILLLACASFAAHSQKSIQVKNMNSGQTLAPNAIVIAKVTEPFENVKVTFDIKNISSSTKTYYARRYDVFLNITAADTAKAYFCFAGSCYDPSVQESPDLLTLTPGESASEFDGNFFMLVSDLDEADVVGKNIVKYSFINLADKSDSVQISVHYNGIGFQPFNLNYGFSSFTSGSGSTDPTPTQTALGAGFSNFSAVGTGANASSGGVFAFSGWPTGSTDGGNDPQAMTGALNTGSYYEITVTPQLGYYLTLHGVKFDVNRNSSGPRNFAVRSTAGNFAGNISAQVTGNANLDVNNSNAFFWKYDSLTAMQEGSSNLLYEPAYKNFTDPISFRFYGWNAESASGVFGIDNVVFDGFASVIITGLGEISHNLAAPFRMFPNPSDGAITLQAEKNFDVAEVINSLGAVVAKTTAKSNIVQLDLSDLSSGIYHVRLTSGSDSRTEKLIITK
jgi:hypothetical protein